MQARVCWVSVWLVACHDVVFVCEGAQCSDALLMYKMYHDLCLGGSACLLSMGMSPEHGLHLSDHRDHCHLLRLRSGAVRA